MPLGDFQSAYGNASDEELSLIHHALTRVENDRGVTVIAARDYGSRMNRTDHDESDFDVMFLYVPTYEDLVSGRAQDVIDEDYGHPKVELHGWSLRKFIGRNAGLMGSNPQALAFVTSDQEYYTRGGIETPLGQMCTHARKNFVPYALIQHNRSKAASNYRKYVEGHYKIASGASYDELLDLVQFDDLELGKTVVDREATEIGTDFVDVGLFQESNVTVNVPIQDAIDAGVVEKTTTDRTVKRTMTVIDALLRAKYIEKTYELPPPATEELLEFHDIAGHHLDLMESNMAKKKRGQNTEIGNPLGDWIEAELERDVSPENYTKRHLDSDWIQGPAAHIVERLHLDD